MNCAFDFCILFDLPFRKIGSTFTGSIFLNQFPRYFSEKVANSVAEQAKSYERVLTYLEDALRTGELSLGQALPPERDLAEQLGISRNSVREAVRLLEHMGFVISSQGSGNFISCNIQRNLKDSFELLMLLQRIDYHQLADLRTGLELQAALLAAERITDVQAEELIALVREMASCSSERAAHLDKQLHDTIASISGNELIIQIHRALSSTIDQFITDMRRRILLNFQTGGQLQYAHEQIVDALARRDKLQLTLAINHHFNVVNEGMERTL